ncbi:hypothetical protein LPB67_09750 [Undibacterium sp. Jales W-56]|uniref:3'-5' exonuclease n=1 Tax=Undibacterium sp. Jales W-56 TaxID=2897325 RepID=UPI0021CF5B0A|nr:hypothetical protein [Undibacterium sp. Jales W-56]MCU6434049.1 hypothetical protein [Undibacterium sp. Jales W-56]
MMTVPIIIDFEASGFGKGSYPIEVGFSGRHGEGWCTLIRPEDDWNHWDLDAAKVHHIPREILVERGRSAIYVADQLNYFLSGYTVYTDGWTQDYVWMARLFDAAQKVPRFKLADLREIISNEQETRWHATKDRVQEELHVSRHRASSDARILQLTWLRTFDSQLDVDDCRTQ